MSFQKISKSYKRIILKNALMLFITCLLVAAVLLHWVSGIYLIPAVILFLAAAFIIKYIENRKLTGSTAAFEGFSHLPHLNTFEETLPKIYVNRENTSQGVLLIHGFSASSHEFRFLCDKLREEGISFYAPTLTGFGLDSVERLKSTRTNDWRRDVLEAYRVLSSFTDTISVVAHSMGAMLALELQKTLPVKHLILTAPYVREKKYHTVFKLLLASPLTAPLVRFVNPVVKKNTRRDLEELRSSGRFVYTSVPIEAVERLWELVAGVTFGTEQCDSTVVLFSGRDNTIDTASVRALFAQANPNCTFETFAGSGHNLLEDVEHEAVVNRIISLLRADGRTVQ